MCDQCDRPKFIFSENETAIKVWGTCNAYSRQQNGMSGTLMKLSISEIKATCDIYECTIEDFENVLMIESIIFPFMIQAQEQHKPPKKAAKHGRH